MTSRHLNAAIASLLLTTPLSAAATSFIPQVRQDGDVRYLSGGIGLEERRELASLASDYNLMLIFASLNGHYLAGVHTRVENASGEVVLDTSSQGPWLLADLEPGVYKVEVGVFNHDFERRVEIPPAGGTRVELFQWRWEEEPDPFLTRGSGSVAMTDGWSESLLDDTP